MSSFSLTQLSVRATFRSKITRKHILEAEHFTCTVITSNEDIGTSRSLLVPNARKCLCVPDIREGHTVKWILMSIAFLYSKVFHLQMRVIIFNSQTRERNISRSDYDLCVQNFKFYEILHIQTSHLHKTQPHTFPLLSKRSFADCRFQKNKLASLRHL